MAPTPEEHVAHVRRFLTDVVAGGDVDAFDAFVTDNVSRHDLVFGENPLDENAKAACLAVLAAATEVDVTIEDTVAQGDLVAVRTTVSGTMNGSLLALGPRAESFEITHVWFYRFEGGLIAETWSLPDGLGLVQQLDTRLSLSSNRTHNG